MVGVLMSVGVMTVGVMSVGEITVGVMTVGVMTVVVMRRPRIILVYKTELSSFVNIVESESKYILWFKLNKNLLHLPQDVLFGIVYVPPENSKYCIGDPFNEIENELSDFSTNF